MKKIVSICLLLTVFNFSCDDILEEDITDDVIQTISPTNGEIIEGNTVRFSWNELDGADEYRLQILKSPAVILDSTITSNNFVYILNEGNYQWRVKGKNFAFDTQYTFPIDFEVVPTDDISDQLIILQSPSSNLYTNDPNLTFTWTALSDADYYTIEIVKIENGEQAVFQQADITDSSIAITADTFADDAEYKWRIKGHNSTSETAFSERRFYIDRENPNQPQLLSPNDQEITTAIVDFSWDNGTDPGNFTTQLTNIIEISTDINFANIIEIADTTEETYQYVFSEMGTYYWRVKAIDQASNESEYSSSRTLTIN